MDMWEALSAMDIVTALYFDKMNVSRRVIILTATVSCYRLGHKCGCSTQRWRKDILPREVGYLWRAGLEDTGASRYAQKLPGVENAGP
ncbi:MAG: hypothetical protein ACLVJO_04315 [[Clostridium] scindens]